jgi:hypothetical protein
MGRERKIRVGMLEGEFDAGLTTRGKTGLELVS